MNPLVAPHYISQEIPPWVDTLGRTETLIDIPMFLVGGPSSDGAGEVAGQTVAGATKLVFVKTVFWGAFISTALFGLVWWEGRR